MRVGKAGHQPSTEKTGKKHTYKSKRTSLKRAGRKVILKESAKERRKKRGTQFARGEWVGKQDAPPGCRAQGRIGERGGTKPDEHWVRDQSEKTGGSRNLNSKRDENPQAKKNKECKGMTSGRAEEECRKEEPFGQVREGRFTDTKGEKKNCLYA